MCTAAVTRTADLQSNYNVSFGCKLKLLLCYQAIYSLSAVEPCTLLETIFMCLFLQSLDEEACLEGDKRPRAQHNGDKSEKDP